MKSIYQLLVCCIALSLWGCDTNDDEAPVRDQLTLSPSTERIVLDQNKPNEEVLTFTWTEATNIGPGYHFQYIFRMDIAGNDFETVVEPIIAQDGVFSISFTNEELYTYVVEKLGGVAGQETAIEGRICAKVLGPKFVYPEIAIQQVIIQTYVPKSMPLYMIGTATDAGMDISKAILLTEVSNGRVYTWKGALKQGEYKFIYSQESMLPSLNRGDADTVLVKRETEADPDNYFKIKTDGTYSIQLSLKDMLIRTKSVKYQNLYLVGNATTAEWSTDSALPMIMDSTNPATFTITTTLKEGELKILTEKRWEGATFRPMVANGSIMSTETQVYVGGEDLKWKITADQAGTYKITLDTENNKIYFVKI